MRQNFHHCSVFPDAALLPVSHEYVKISCPFAGPGTGGSPSPRTVACIRPGHYITAMLRRLTALFAPFVALLGFGPASLANAEPSSSSYPSLAPRPVESRDRDAEIARAQSAAQPAAPAAADPALERDVQALSTRANDAYADSRGAIAAARGAAPGSEAWVMAQQTISRLDADRYACVTALASLDTLYAERSMLQDIGRAKADIATIDGVRLRVLAMVDSQNDRLDSLKAALSQP